MTQIAKTTLEYKGVKYPFYKTNRGDYDWENAGFTQDDLVRGKGSAAMALAYFTVRDCAKRAGTPITDSLDDFIDNTDPDVLHVFKRLEEEKKRIASAQAEKDMPEKKHQPEESPDMQVRQV